MFHWSAEIRERKASRKTYQHAIHRVESRRTCVVSSGDFLNAITGRGWIHLVIPITCRIGVKKIVEKTYMKIVGLWTWSDTRQTCDWRLLALARTAYPLLFLLYFHHYRHTCLKEPCRSRLDKSALHILCLFFFVSPFFTRNFASTFWSDCDYMLTTQQSIQESNIREPARSYMQHF